MNMNIKGRHMAVTPPIHDYAEEKIGRTSKILDQDTMTVEVELYVEKNPSIENNQVAEVTVWTKRGRVIRAKEASTDMYAAIDLVSDKLERQFRKYKGKMDDRHRGKHAPPPPPLPPIDELVPLPDEDGSIVKTKAVELQADDARRGDLAAGAPRPRLLHVRVLRRRSCERSLSSKRR